jgi:hypothetical protein
MEKEEKEDKPKKMFIIEHVIWDDGEVDTKLVEFRKTNSGRGAPNKWTMQPKDFKRRMTELLGSPEQINEILVRQSGLDDSGPIGQVSIYPVGTPEEDIEADTPPMVDESDEKPQEKTEKPKKSDKKKSASNSSDSIDIDSVDFGEFDK